MSIGDPLTGRRERPIPDMKTAIAVPACAPAALRRILEVVESYVLLTKPRIVLLVMVTGLASLVLEGSLRGNPRRFWGVVLGILLAAGAASAFNQVWDRDIDAVMARTRSRRPIPTGKVSVRGALWFSALAGTVSIWLLSSAGNALAAMLGLGAVVVYLLYTVWLKRRTPLNIVIGGAAGAAAPLIGWAAGAGGLDTVALLMSLVVFLWTPPHFWALALWKKEEYALAGVPMLPVVAGEKSTRLRITVYVALLLTATAGFGIDAQLGRIFLCVTTVMGIILVRKVIRLHRRKDHASAKALFSFSVVYLAAVCALTLGCGC